MKKITLSNEWHGTQISLTVKDNWTLSSAQVRLAKRTLCGVSGCMCSDSLGMRGPQDGFEIEPLFDGMSGAITGAVVYEA